jgi:predicted permease
MSRASSSVISFWQRRLSGGPSIFGKTIAIQGAFFTLLGTTAEEFSGTGLPPQAPDLWLPLSMQSRILPSADWLHDTTAALQILARRKPEVSLQQASAELDALGATLPLVDDQRLQVRAKPATFSQADTGEFETFVTISRVLMVAVALVLLIGCVNLVNLLMARSAARERELAVRMALGASRLQLIRQLSTESMILGILGGAAGFLLSAWSSAWIRSSLIETLRRVTGGMLAVSPDVSPDWRIFAYTAILSALTGVAVGLWPAVRASRTDINAALKGDGSTLGRALQSRWSRRNLLLTIQVAACLMLLAGGSWLFRGVWRSRSTDPGFEARQLFLLGVDPKAIAATPAAQTALLRRVSDRLAELPEIASVAVADHPPFIGHGSGPFQNDRRQDVQCLFNRVSDSYFETLGIPLLAGRTFTRLETESQAPVAVISESAAKALWPGHDPLGRRVYPYDWIKNELPRDSYTVIGVVKTVRSTYLSKVDSPFLYFPRPPDI